MSRRLGFVLSVFVSLLSTASTASESQLAGQFFFASNVDPSKVHCAKIDATMAGRLVPPSYTCSKANVSSGGQATDCTKADGRSGYLIFKTFAACEEERKTEAVAE